MTINNSPHLIDQATDQLIRKYSTMKVTISVILSVLKQSDIIVSLW